MDRYFLDIAPQLIETVEGTFVFLEYMHYHVEIVHQYPLGVLVALYLVRIETGSFLDSLEDGITQRTDMRRHIARGDNEEFGRCAMNLPQVEYAHVVALLLIDSLRSKLRQYD